MYPWALEQQTCQVRCIASALFLQQGSSEVTQWIFLMQLRRQQKQLSTLLLLLCCWRRVKILIKSKNKGCFSVTMWCEFTSCSHWAFFDKILSSKCGTLDLKIISSKHFFYRIFYSISVLYRSNNHQHFRTEEVLLTVVEWSQRCGIVSTYWLGWVIECVALAKKGICVFFLLRHMMLRVKGKQIFGWKDSCIDLNWMCNVIFCLKGF